MPPVPPCGPMPTCLPSSSATDWIGASGSTMNWNGVSYIGNSARALRNCFPPVHSPLPLQPCCAMPSVTNASWISPDSMSLRFSTGPSVSRAATAKPSLRVSSRASPSPY